MLAVVGFHRGFEVAERVVRFFIDRNIDFRRCSPENDHAVALFLGFELADVLAQCLDHLPARDVALRMVAVEPLGVVFVESGLHRHDFFEFVAHGFDVLALQNFGIDRRLISVLRIDIPTAENEVVERGDGRDFAVFQILFRFALAHADFVIQNH